MNLRDFVKGATRQVMAHGMFGCGGCALLIVLRPAKCVRILSYHGVCESTRSSLDVTPQNFARQMQYITRHFTVLSIADVVDRLQNSQPIAPRTIAISIDDGLRSTYTHAFPVLRRFGLPATVFVPSAFLEPEHPASDAHISWKQAREMQQHGIDFGSHTVSHIALTTLTPDRAWRELNDSKERLQAEIEQPVWGLSYPYGAFNRQVMQLASQAGYKWAVAGLSGVNGPGTNLFALRRTKIERNDSMSVFKKALYGALDPWLMIDRYRLIAGLHHRKTTFLPGWSETDQ